MVRINFFVSLFLPGSLYFSVTRGAVPAMVEREEEKEKERKLAESVRRNEVSGFV